MHHLHHSTDLEEVGWARLLALVEEDLELSAAGMSWVPFLPSVEGNRTGSSARELGTTSCIV